MMANKKLKKCFILDWGNFLEKLDIKVAFSGHQDFYIL